MKQKTIIATTLIAVLTCFPTALIGAGQYYSIARSLEVQTSYGKQEIIVQFLPKNDTSFYVQARESSLQNLCSSYNLQILDRNLYTDDNNSISIQSNIADRNGPVLLKISGNLQETLALLNDPTTKAIYDIKYTEPNYLYSPCIIYNDPLNQEQQLDRDSIYVSTGRDVAANTDIIVNSLDTGGDLSHNDLQENLIPGAWDYVTDSPNVSEQVIHGTFTLGPGAVSDNNIGISGIAHRVPLLVSKISTPEGLISTFAAIKAIDRQLLSGKRTVFNASWAGPGQSQALDEAIDRIGAAGSLFVTAAGNSSNNNDIKTRHS